MQKKELHLGQCLDDLKPMFELDKAVTNKPTSALVISLKKLKDEAEKKRMDGDEEVCYVLYMKYMSLLSALQKKPDYAREKDFVMKLIGNNTTIAKLFDRIQVIQNSLKERYDEAYPIKSRELMPLGELVMNIEDEEQQPPPPVPDSITCEALYEKMTNNEKLLIMDCRTEEHYQTSRMNYQYTMNVPEEIIDLGMTASKIQRALPNGSKVFWELRAHRHFIIIVDWFSARFNRNSAVWHLKEILVGWDEDVEKKPEMLLLEGGYEKWKTLYPHKCNNPQFDPPKETNGDAPTIDGIEYPNIEDITMKGDESMNISVPMIDRSMKMNAINNSLSKTKLELLEEKEILLNKSLQNEQELIKLETEYKAVANNKENDGDASSKEQAFLFKIWELSSQQRDNQLHENTIKDQLGISIEQPSSNEMTKVKQIEHELMLKELQRKHLQEERERKKKEREEALKFARDRKPQFNDHRTPPKSQRKDELILSPKSLSNQVITPSSIPSIDRSSKPLQSLNRQVYNEPDFAPVFGRVLLEKVMLDIVGKHIKLPSYRKFIANYRKERGLTGLKNLGNTCYMNSIIQCLSNTSTLKDFLSDNKYERYLNISNKTKGHIVRTLAAVIRMLWNGECKYINSKHLKSVLGEQDRLYYGTEQQDSHEFLIMLIDWLQSDLQTIPVYSMVESLPPSEKAWLEYTKAKESFILRLFYGQIKSTVKCTVCSKESATYETFSNLSLELPPSNVDRCHIQESFNMYFNGERVKGWNCPHCKSPRDAIKKLDISKLPPVLVIHLKRFSAETYTNSFKKKTLYVDFPLGDMNMLPYVARSEKNNGSNSKHTYKLYAVSNHYGTMESGHYTAFCRNSNLDKWYKFDDDKVSSLDGNEVRSSAAYILFYTAYDDMKHRR